MKAASANQVQVGLDPGITAAGRGMDEVVWNILGHTYYLKAEGANAFAFETYDPPGTFVPPHVHPTQDEFIHVLENEFDLYLDGQHRKARAGDLVRLPRCRRGRCSGWRRPGACASCSTRCTTSAIPSRWCGKRRSARCIS